MDSCSGFSGFYIAALRAWACRVQSFTGLDVEPKHNVLFVYLNPKP